MGFDIARGVAILPDTPLYDLMSYCNPEWVTAYTYGKLIDMFQSPGPSSLVEGAALVAGQFWQVSGTVGEGGATLNPLFQLEVSADTGPGSGSHRIELRDSSGAVLLTRLFEPLASQAQEYSGQHHFFQLAPVDTAASSIVVIDNTGSELANVALGGAPPVVDVTFPSGGETLTGTHIVEWTVTDPDSSGHTHRLHYSTDGGATWQALSGNLAETGLKVDFNNFSGTVDGRIRVLSSYGVNTGVGISGPFSVPRKSPVAKITYPANDTAFPQLGQLVWLQGFALDPEDGVLDGADISWTSDVDGFLDNGRRSMCFPSHTHLMHVQAVGRQGLP